MKYSLSWLKNQIHRDVNPEYFFFGGHTPKKEGVIDKSCFNQWFLSPFTVNEVVYPTAEHWMMAKKAELFNDKKIVKKILAEKNPAVVKELGRQVENFDLDIWNSASYKIVVEGNKEKFMQNKPIKDFLIQTGSKIIAEASPGSTIWGTGLSYYDEEVRNPFRWKGENLLGFALMEVRDYLKQADGKET